MEILGAIVRKNSASKGIRWDDIVTKFEYEAIAMMELVKQVQSSSIGAPHKKFLIERVQTKNELDT